MDSALLERLKQGTPRDATKRACFEELAVKVAKGEEVDPDEVATLLAECGMDAEDLDTEAKRLETRWPAQKDRAAKPEARRQQMALEEEQRRVDAEENRRLQEYTRSSAERRAEMMRLGVIADNTHCESVLVTTAPQRLRDRDNELAEEGRKFVPEQRQLARDIEDTTSRLEQAEKRKADGHAVNEEWLKVWRNELTRWRERLAVVEKRQAEIQKERDELYQQMLTVDF